MVLILSATADGDASTTTIYPARDQVRGTAIYVLNHSNNGLGAKTGSYGSYCQLRWGMDDIKDLSTEGDPDAIWRFVPAPDSLGKRAYYIQNMHTGMYFNKPNETKGDFYINASYSAMPYRVEYIGKKQFNIIPLFGGRKGTPLQFGNNARQIRVDDISGMYDNRASLTFREFSVEDQSAVASLYDNNTAQIVTLPYDVQDFSQSTGVKAYAVHSISEDGSKLGLKAISSAKAGVPFIMVIGDTTLYAESHEPVEIWTDISSDLTTKADTVNGLIGSFKGASLKTAGLGYIKSNLLQAVADKKVSVDGMSGYINPGLIVNGEGEPDVWIPLFGTGKLNAISQPKAGKNADLVDVYTIDGVRVKHNVAPAEAAKGLTKGVYIIGKKKVSIK